MSLFITFLIGFCIGGVVGCNSPKSNTNTPPPLYNLKDQENTSKFKG